MFLSLSKLDCSPQDITPGKFDYTWHIQRIGVNVTKIGKKRVRFKSDVLAAVAVVDANALYIYEAAPISLFWAPNVHNKLPAEMRFEFPFNQIGKLTMAF